MSTKAADAAAAPLYRRYPALRDIPRATFGAFPTPLERLTLDDREILLKRDDRSGHAIGGNKVRGLEFLLGDATPADHVLTVGPTGSTHALATARCARARGAPATVFRWTQVMNPAATAVDALLRREARVVDLRWVPAVYIAAAVLRLRRNTRWIPAGGATPLAILGHVNAALELADQLHDEASPPDALYVPFGTGGTAAGLALGLRLADVPTRVIAVRVVPAFMGRAGRITRLANRAARLIESRTGERLPRLVNADITVEHASYGGAYGRPLGLHTQEATVLRDRGIRLDDTYSHKAFSAMLRGQARRPLLWLTFDGRLHAH